MTDMIIELTSAYADSSRHLYVHDNGAFDIHQYWLEFVEKDFSVLYSYAEKMRHAFASLCGMVSDGSTFLYGHTAEHRLMVYEEISDGIKKHFPQVNNIVLPTGYVEKGYFYEMFDEGERYYGCVMEENRNLVQAFLDRKKISIDDFLYDSRYIIITGDDGQYAKLKKHGIIKKAAIVQEFTVTEENRK